MERQIGERFPYYGNITLEVNESDFKDNNKCENNCYFHDDNYGCTKNPTKVGFCSIRNDKKSVYFVKVE